MKLFFETFKNSKNTLINKYINNVTAVGVRVIPIGFAIKDVVLHGGSKCVTKKGSNCCPIKIRRFACTNHL